MDELNNNNDSDEEELHYNIESNTGEDTIQHIEPEVVTPVDKVTVVEDKDEEVVELGATDETDPVNDETVQPESTTTTTEVTEFDENTPFEVTEFDSKDEVTIWKPPTLPLEEVLLIQNKNENILPPKPVKSVKKKDKRQQRERVQLEHS